MPISDSNRKWWALSGISILSVVAYLDFTIVSTALPSIQSSLQMNYVELQWVMNAFVLANCIFMVNIGRMGDIFGSRLFLYIGAVVFGISTLMGGLSSNGDMLIIFRALQGFSNAIIIPASLALISNIFSENERGRAIGLWTSATGIGLAIGPVLGGIIVSSLSWRWVFFVNIPVLVIGTLICLMSVRDIQHKVSNKKIDWPGFILMIIGIGSLITVLIQASVWGWFSSKTIMLFIVAAISLIALYIVEKRVSSPILDFDLFLNRGFMSGALANFSLLAFAYAAFFLMPLYLGNIRGEDSSHIGYFLLSVTVLIILVAPYSGKIVDKRGAKLPILVGLAALAVSALMQSTFSINSTHIYILLGFIFMGIGWGFIYGSGAFAAISSVPKEFAGTATGALWTIQNFGGAIGLAIAGIIFRLLEKDNLDNGLASSGVQLSHEQRDLIRSLLSDPDKSKHILSQFTDATADKILPIFEHSFMRGYSGAFIFLMGICVVAFAIIFLIMKDVKRGKAT
ncbi:MAG: MFS transporter [Thermodesulfobacteriota bacterium]